MKGFFNYWTMYIPMIAMNIAPLPGVYGRVQDMADDPCGWILRLQAHARDGVKAELSAVSAVSAAAGTVPELAKSIAARWAAVLYLLYACVLICDHLEKKPSVPENSCCSAFMTAVLTQWRSEGIYLLVLGLVLLYSLPGADA